MNARLPIGPAPFLAAVLAASTAWAASNRTVHLKVENMTCAMCPITVRKALEEVDGVKEAKASYETQSATVTFDPDRSTVETLTRATREAGYPSHLKSKGDSHDDGQ